MNPKTLKETKKVVEKSKNYWAIIDGNDFKRFTSKENALKHIQEGGLDYSCIYLLEVVREFDLEEPNPITIECKKGDLDFED